MLHENHDLVHELPEYKDKIHTLKMTNAHFARLFEEYHSLGRDILRFEKAEPPTSDDHLEALKKQRLVLKDELFLLLKAA
jgi:hypothetical protein